VISLFLGLILLVGLLFPSFIQDTFVTPLALVLWLVWRILQSVDQKIYWILLVCSVLIYFLTRLYRSIPEPPAFEKASATYPNAALERIDYWKTLIQLTAMETSAPSIMQDSLAKLLAALYASRQPDAVLYEIYDALKLRQVPLPESIGVFLFPEKTTGVRRSFKRRLQAVWNVPRRQIRRWTGRETADYYQTLEQVIDYMESILEQNYGDDNFNAHHD
jgi:hypothetical protein